mgnify:CR=1 FL=1
MSRIIVVDTSKLAKFKAVLIVNSLPKIVLDNPHAHANILHLEYLYAETKTKTPHKQPKNQSELKSKTISHE